MKHGIPEPPDRREPRNLDEAREEAETLCGTALEEGAELIEGILAIEAILSKAKDHVRRGHVRWAHSKVIEAHYAIRDLRRKSAAEAERRRKKSLQPREG